MRILERQNALHEASDGRIEQLTSLRMHQVSHLVLLIRAGDKKQAERLVKGGTGVAVMSQIREEVGKFSQEEERSNAEARRTLETSWQELSWLLVAGTSASILLASLLTLLFSGGISRRLEQLRDNALSLAAGKELAPRLAGHDEIAE